MVSKKLEELSVDELMKVAQKKLSKKTKVISRRLTHLEEIKQFILSEDLKSHSSMSVPAILVYDRYKKWCELNHIKIKGQNIFFKEFKNHFKSLKLHNLVRYQIAADGFDLSDHNIKRLQHEKKKKS